jgi:succinate dehydrogenase/fumarate reductase flavoprotein subunit
VGEAALQPKSDRPHTLETHEVIQAVQDEVFPYERNYFRTEKGLSQSLNRLHSLWQEIRDSQVAGDRQIVKAREAAAMVATARWMYSSALERQETRGMHRHLDYPELDANQQHYLISGGLDRVWVKPQPLDSNLEAGFTRNSPLSQRTSVNPPSSETHKQNVRVGASL